MPVNFNLKHFGKCFEMFIQIIKLILPINCFKLIKLNKFKLLNNFKFLK